MAVVVLHDMVNRPPSRFYFHNVLLFRGTRVCNFIYAHRKGMVTPAQIFLELIKCEQHYVYL
jgi:hypothetical protein